MKGTDAAAPFLFVAPFLLLFLVFTVVPSAATFVLAWFDWDPLAGQRWIGAANFTRLAQDPRFWIATGNTLAIAALATIAQLAIGLTLAHLLRVAVLRLGPLLRVSLLLPFVTSGAAIAILTAQFVDRDHGTLSRALAWFGIDGVDLLATPLGAWLVVAAMVAWRWFGFTTLLMFTVLTAVPRDLYRAAQLDGAGGWAQFRYVSLPALGPVLVFSLVTSIVGVLQLFAEPLMVDPTSVTCGPLRQCQTLALLVYEIGFRDHQFGYAAAVSTTVFAMAGAMILVVFAATRWWRR